MWMTRHESDAVGSLEVASVGFASLKLDNDNLKLLRPNYAHPCLVG
jgi:hypothetical protein